MLSSSVAYADKGASHEAQKVEAYTKHFYNQLNFRGHQKMQYKTFQFAMKGYLNLVEDGRLNNRRYFTICDFSMSSNLKRLWVVDMIGKRIVYNTLVAHGAKTGEEYAKYFSNRNGSHQSSLGFYVTMNTYNGSNGYSMRLQGVDGGYNNAAFKRDVVMHGAKYVSPQFARAHKRIGRSWGCPAVPVHMARPIISTIQNGSALFIYHPSQHYLHSSYWLNNRIARMPREADRVLLQQKRAEQLRQKREKKPASSVSFKSRETSPKKKAVEKPAVEKKTEAKKVTAPVEKKVKKKAPVVVFKKRVEEVLDPSIQRIHVPKDQVTKRMKLKAEKSKSAAPQGIGSSSVDK